ncbi:hypothetical protein SAMN05444506_11721 [Pseudomonas syringae]|uniref:Uncharacterized protein n=1 Tax=Pseudomonas syringae pv. apii TaxID=81036 RepID=A0A3M3S2I5_9PSED|nr:MULTISPECIES: hypothetical protein [Pseudomonas syringae group]RMN40296.1 hypothetical protein ALQ59_200021 [Pseudomonas syringae pv. apii]RMN56185.1 hypothetical protein ALQ58_200468 [Pseudomonas syringae pv. apii]RMO02748.1 hypothetical protein ALQ49_02402 [Pseudomonas syringae pv. apii]SDZ38850.1 hypothetical protein SAMN05444506_11721 [Pseudomonas syringae]
MDNNTVFAGRVVLDASAVLNERQIGWAGRWSLMGDFVLCTQCLAAQSIGQAFDPFEHKADCVARHYGMRPRHELQRLMNQVPRLPTEPLH